MFHACAHLLSDEDMSNKEVIRHITSWIQNTEVKDCGVFSQVVKYFYFLICLLLQDWYDMVISMANIMGIGTVSRTPHLVNQCGVIRAVTNISTDNSSYQFS